jgi:type I restriction enzyme S subunit
MSSDNRKLSDIANIQGGYAFKSADFCDDGIAVIKIANIQPPNISLNDVDRVKEEKLVTLDRFKLLNGDILMAMTGATVGKVGRFKGVEPAYLNQRVARISAKNGALYDDYIYSIVTQPGFESLIEGVSAGSAQANISAAGIGSVMIPSHSEDQQLEIGSTIALLDDRITLLRETAKSLQAIAGAIFKSWFVDFDPVHARVNDLTLAGINPASLECFPNEFEVSNIGDIPKGWQAIPLDQTADFLNGLALQRFPPKDDNWLPVIKISQLRKGSSEGADRASGAIRPEYIIKDGDVIFSWSGSLEVEIWCGGEGALNQHLFKVTSQIYPKWFYYLWTRHHLNKFRQIAASKATTMGHIQRGHLSEVMVLVPNPEVLELANEVMGPIIEQIIGCELRAKSILTLRDTVLPRLISGQLLASDNF